MVYTTNKWLGVVLTASFTDVLSFVVGMLMVKKWFSIRNTVTTSNTSVSKVTKQLAGTISLLNTIRGGGTASLNYCQKEYINKTGITWHEILLLIRYEVIILIVIVLIVRLAKHMYQLCNCNNLEIPDSYVKQNSCPIKIWRNKSDISLQISSINKC